MAEPWKIGYEHFHDELTTLITCYPPPFIYINDPSCSTLTATIVSTLLDKIAHTQIGPSKRVFYVKINAVACFTTRLLYDSILNGLAKWNTSWANGCLNWGIEGDTLRFNEHFDAFIHGLRALNNTHLSEKFKSKGKGKAQSGADAEDVRLIIVVERAEKLKEIMPELLVPLTRLTELVCHPIAPSETQLDLSVILISEVRWEDVRPSLGASPDPYFIDLPPQTKEVKVIVERLISKFTLSEDFSAGPYHPTFHGLYSHFVTVLCDVCYPFIHNPHEIEYIAAARWPGFVQPVLDQQTSLEDEMDLDEQSDHRPLKPQEDVRMRLSRMFNTSLNLAMEDLYPRIKSASDWAESHKPEPNLLSAQTNQIASARNDESKDSEAAPFTLPRMSKFILVASFLASTNPAKSDIRMFGRGLDEKKRRRRARKATKSGPGKVPQRLLGPASFALDRLLAVLGALLEENDVETRLTTAEFMVPGEYTDMETSRASVYSAVGSHRKFVYNYTFVKDFAGDEAHIDAPHSSNNTRRQNQWSPVIQMWDLVPLDTDVGEGVVYPPE
ncbi:hypothetical protein H0H93_011562 [Arthromyces matolae]|nr:hypothetical protein H0H93_011562 [Arthromyces matolae]